jgi:hypothetical protein
MHLLPYALRRLLHRPKRARRSAPDPVIMSDQREHDLRRYQPRSSAPPPRDADQEPD